MERTERTVKLNEDSYAYLIQMLQEKYYSTVDVEELRKINEIYKALGCKSETWLSMMEPKKNQKEKK
jgi:hypothetical protein